MRTRDNRRLLNAVRQIRIASLQALWTDDPEAFPNADHEQFWWGVWLPVRQDQHRTAAAFRDLAQAQEMQVAERTLLFPEHTGLVVYTPIEQMQCSITTLNSLASLRRTKETAGFLDSLPVDEQLEWLDDISSADRICR